jgi:hypothetical protein
MYALNNLKGKEKDDGDHSTTKYTSLGTIEQSSFTTIKNKNSKPPLWNTLEFYVYYIIVIVSLLYAFYVGYRISKGML